MVGIGYCGKFINKKLFTAAPSIVVAIRGVGLPAGLAGATVNEVIDLKLFSVDQIL